MNKSESISKLAEALSKAQGAIKNALKDSSNPYFKSKYADLASVWDACRAELSANSLSVVQVPEVIESEAGTKINVHTLLMHSSGEWIDGELKMAPVKDDPQGIGSAITYARRYALSAFVGIAPEDDDGNAASGKPTVDNGQTRRSFRNESAAGNSASGDKPTLVKETSPQAAGTSVAVADEIGIETGQAVNMHVRFRNALKKPIQPQSEKLFAEWLTKKGFVDADGKASAMKIPRDLFNEFRDEAEKYARMLG